MKQANKTIILHDYFLYKGGGERLVIAMADALGADIATAFIAKDAFDPRTNGRKVIELLKESFFSRLPGFRYLQVQFAFLFKTGFLKHYDTVIYSGDCLVALLRAGHAKNIAYMHTPPRHLFDRYADTLAAYSFFKKLLFIPFAALNRWRFKTLSHKFHRIITNSENTKKRIRTYLNLDATVVYPPCDTLPFKNLEHGDYFFSWARLYHIKRVEMIVRAFAGMPDQKLVVASGGPDMERITQIAKGCNNIRIIGWISEQELLEYLGRCRASIYIPVREDFGMSAAESMAAGKPVIGSAEGGLLEIIEHEKNGLFVETPVTPEHVQASVRSMTAEKAAAMEQACYETAQKFTTKAFNKNIRTAINRTV
ncbi:MAG: glycosyltransferase [bacterium]|nr:glycosyltransferase [bacterium]